MQRIPDRIVFVWLGRSLPDVALVAIWSARAANPGAEVVVLHDGLEGPAEPGVTFEPVTDAIFDAIPAGDAAARLYRTLPSPTARSNLLRLAALYHHGGIYLDTDTITIRDLAPLRRLRGFCGAEHVACPGTTWRSRSRRRNPRSGPCSVSGPRSRGGSSSSPPGGSA